MNVTATDDLAVTGVTLVVDGTSVSTDSTAPYQFTVQARLGATGITLGAQAGDLGNNVGVAADVVVKVIPDPLTSVTGRVVLQDGTPVSGVAVTCLGERR